MQKKVRVAILFGGKSIEHEISIISARNIIKAMSPEKYDIFPIGIDKAGRWHLMQVSQLLSYQNPTSPSPFLKPGQTVSFTQQKDGVLQGASQSWEIDLVFPILHGTFGEDGTVQGLLEMHTLPFVGASVLGSAIGMDKDIMKRLLRDANIPIARFIALYAEDRETVSFEYLSERLGLPFFVKPACRGSSIGVSKVKKKEDFDAALELAFHYDRKVMIEEFIPGRELECSVLGNERPIASIVGEILSKGEFYSYYAKYFSDAGTEIAIPANIAPSTMAQIQSIAVSAYKALCCEGMARLDFFLKPNQEVIFNEINTIPGFTDLSLYPLLWLASGLSYPELVDKLIELALARSAREKRLQMSLSPKNLSSLAQTEYSSLRN